MKTDRVVEIRTAQIEIEPSSSAGLSATLATDIFLDIANHLGFVVDGPHRDPRTPMEDGYSAHSIAKKGTSMVFLDLLIDGKHISFLCSMDATTEEFGAAQRDAKLFQEALDKRNIKYTVATRASWFWGP